MDTYEKKYKEALQKIRELIEKGKENGWTIITYEKDFEEIFPELKESEDESIRKELIQLISCMHDADHRKKDWLAWIEKQGEQKPILPKWKYKNDNTPLLRDSIILNKYGCVTKSPSGALVSDVWVLDYDELAKLPKEEIEKQGEQKPADKVVTNLLTVERAKEISPFMRSGFENKDKVEPKFKIGDTIVKKQNDFGSFTITDITGGKYWYNDRIICNITEQDDWEIYEQKSAWSEEDETTINNLVWAISNDCIRPQDREDYCDWLKSLRPQNKWKPSDEQITWLYRAADDASKDSRMKQILNELLSDLKKLREG